MLFAKFRNTDDAHHAVSRLNNLLFDEDDPDIATISCQFAHREMDLYQEDVRDNYADEAKGAETEIRPWSRPAPSRKEGPRWREPSPPPPPPTASRRWSPPPRRNGRPGGERRPYEDSPPRKRHRRNHDQDHGHARHDDHGDRRNGHQPAPQVEEIDTLAIKFTGVDQQEEIENFFERCDGFVALKFNGRISTCFVKFEDEELAVNAMDAAREDGLNAEMARRNLHM